MRIFEGVGGPERRYHTDELDAVLRDRILALDEPVSRKDWNDVMAMTGRAAILGMRRPTLAVCAAASFAAAAAVLAVGLGGSSLRPSGSSSQAHAPVRDDFANFKLGTPPIAPDAIASQTRLITSVRLKDASHTLYVSPAKNGGFCYKWTGVLGGGCEQLEAASLSVTWGKKEAVGVISSIGISSVKIEFTDGTTATPSVSWISAPINAGFFLYDIPAGKTVAEIDGDDSGYVTGQTTWFSV